MKLTNALQGVLACLMALGVAQDSASQSSTGHLNGDYPTKPIRFVVPFPASGGADAIARIIGNKLSERWNRTVVIDNRPGAGGIIGADIVAKAAPDGYTIFMGNSGPMAASVSLYKNLPYDPAKDFAPVTLVATAAQILIVNPSSPLKTLNDLIRLAKSNPGQLTYAFGGNGSQAHLAGVLFAKMAGIELVPVPYKGGPLSLVDLLGGRVSCMVTSVPVAFPLVKDGTVRALAVTGTARSSGLPNIPRISEFVPGYEVDSWWGVVAPAGTPKHIISRLKVEITQILGMPDVKEYYLRLGIEPAVSTPAEFAMLIKAEITKWSRVIKDAGIHPQ